MNWIWFIRVLVLRSVEALTLLVPPSKWGKVSSCDRRFVHSLNNQESGQTCVQRMADTVCSFR